MSSPSGNGGIYRQRAGRLDLFEGRESAPAEHPFVPDFSSIIDSPANRADMPDADPDKWVAPEALADVILFLASDKARAIHGAAIPVVGLS